MRGIVFSVRVIFLFLFLLSTYCVTGANDKPRIAVIGRNKEKINELIRHAEVKGLSVIPLDQVFKAAKQLRYDIGMPMTPYVLKEFSKKVHADIIAYTVFLRGNMPDYISVTYPDKDFLLEENMIMRKNGKPDYYSLVKALHRGSGRYEILSKKQSRYVKFTTNISQVKGWNFVQDAYNLSSAFRRSLFEEDGRIVIRNKIIGDKNRTFFFKARKSKEIISFEQELAKTTYMYHINFSFRQPKSRDKKIYLDISIFDKNNKLIKDLKGVPCTPDAIQKVSDEATFLYLSELYPQTNKENIIELKERSLARQREREQTILRQKQYQAELDKKIFEERQLRSKATEVQRKYLKNKLIELDRKSRNKKDAIRDAGTVAPVDRNGKCQIAVIGIGKVSSMLADMVTAKGESKLSFVERDQIKKIMTEHKLSKSGLVEASSIIRMGRLLQADMIVLINDESGSPNIIAFDVNCGVRLEDRAISVKDFDHSVEELVKIVYACAEKYRSLKLNKARFISFLPVNIISKDKESIQSIIKVQNNFKRELLRQSHYLLLERDLIELLIQEQVISGKMLDNLKSCTYAIELEAKVVDSKNKRLMMHAYLKNNTDDIVKDINRKYQIGHEDRTVSEIAQALLHTLLNGEETGSSDRMFKSDNNEHRYNDVFIAFVGGTEKAAFKANIITGLARDRGYKVVDCQNVRQVTKRFVIEKSGSIDVSEAVKMGMAINAGIVAVVITSPSSVRDRVIFWDVMSGIRLNDCMLNDKSDEVYLQGILAGIDKSQYKLNLLNNKKADIIALNAASSEFFPEELIWAKIILQNIEDHIRQILLSDSKKVVLDVRLISKLHSSGVIRTNAISNQWKNCEHANLKVRRYDKENKVIEVCIDIRDANGNIRKKINSVFGQNMSKMELDKLIYAFSDNSVNPHNTDRQSEAKMFMNDSRIAYAKGDYAKSFTSLKNAYLLDYKLKDQVVKILEKNINMVNKYVVKANGINKDKQKREKILAYLKLLFDGLDLYKNINGRFKHFLYMYDYSFYQLPEEWQNRIRTYYHEYFKQELLAAQKEFDYFNEDKWSMAYIRKYRKYLFRLGYISNPGWTSEYWAIYMAPALKKYIKEASSHEYGNLVKYVIFSMNNRMYLPNDTFIDGDRIFSAEAFNKYIDICQQIYNTNFLRWKIDVKKTLDHTLLYFPGKSHSFPLNIRRQRYGIHSNLLYCLKGKDKNYERNFLKFLSYKSAEDSPDTRKIVKNYFFHNINNIYVNDKLDTDLFDFATKFGFTSIIYKYKDKIRSSPDSITNIEQKQSKIRQWKLLRKIAEKNGADEVLKIIDKEINTLEYYLKEHKFFAKGFGFDKYFSTTRNVLEEAQKTSGVLANVKYCFVMGAIRENNYVYSLILSNRNNRYYLVRTDLDKNFETVIGAPSLKRKDSYSSYQYPNCITPEYFVHASVYSDLVLCPKDGRRPEIYKYDALKNKQVKWVFYWQGKVLLIVPGKPFDIIQFDLQTKSFGILFSGSQKKSNPFIGQSRRLCLNGMPYLSKESGYMVFPVSEAGYSSKWNLWEYNLKNGDWRQYNNQIDQNGYSIIRCLDRDVYVVGNKDTISYYDFSINKKRLKSFIVNNNLNPNKASGSYIKFSIKKQRNGTKYMCSTINSNGEHIWDNISLILLKNRIILEYNSYNFLFFVYNGKRYCVVAKKWKVDKLKLYFGILKSDEELAGGRDGNNGIEIEYLN